MRSPDRKQRIRRGLARHDRSDPRRIARRDEEARARASRTIASPPNRGRHRRCRPPPCPNPSSVLGSAGVAKPRAALRPTSSDRHLGTRTKSAARRDGTRGQCRQKCFSVSATIHRDVPRCDVRAQTRSRSRRATLPRRCAACAAIASLPSLLLLRIARTSATARRSRGRHRPAVAMLAGPIGRGRCRLAERAQAPGGPRAPYAGAPALSPAAHATAPATSDLLVADQIEQRGR